MAEEEKHQPPPYERVPQQAGGDVAAYPTGPYQPVPAAYPPAYPAPQSPPPGYAPPAYAQHQPANPPGGYPPPGGFPPQPPPGYQLQLIGYDHQASYHLAPVSEQPGKRQVAGQRENVSQFVIVENGPPPSNMMLSCFVLWCCCVPLGLVAVMYSHSSSVAANQGNYVKAERKGKVAKMAGVAGIVIGVVFAIILGMLRIYVSRHHRHWP